MKVKKVISVILFCIILLCSLINIVQAQSNNMEIKFIYNTLDGHLARYIIGQEENFAVSVSPVSIDDNLEDILSNIRFTINDTNVAQITKAEKSVATVKFIGIGEAKITATLIYNGETYSDSYYFKVVEDSAGLYDVYIRGENNIKVGETSQLKLTKHKGTTTPIDITSEATWSTDNEKIAKVNSSGLVTGVSDGYATITATYKIEDKVGTKSYEIKVKGDRIGISIIEGREVGTVYQYVLNEEKTFLMHLDNIPKSERENIKFTTSDENIAKVIGKVSGDDIIGAKLKFVGIGKVKFTATLTYNGETYSDSYEFTVKEKADSLYKLNISGDNNLKVGETSQLKANLMYAITGPEDKTKEVEWSTNNEKVAKINSEGLVIAISEGNCIITAKFKAESETVTATYKIVVAGNSNGSDPTIIVEGDSNSSDPTIAVEPIPQTGEYKIILYFIAISLFTSILIYIAYRKYRNIIK